jgi:hypothetical protein
MCKPIQQVLPAALVLWICGCSVTITKSLMVHQATSAMPIRQRLNSVKSTQRIAHRRTFDITLAALNDDIIGQPDELLSIASKIREEVRELEAAAALSRQGKNIGLTGSLPTNTTEYLDIGNSFWALSYRFATDPEESIERNNGNAMMQRRLFGGKVTVGFRQDGYTDIISQESYGTSIENCNLIKAWGWDVELSKDNENDADMNDQEFILFSVDVEFPSITGASTTTTKERFYFQARKDTDARTGIISLADGTVTIKRDIVEKSTRWGFFSPAGILAQFRYVGGFVAKPVPITVTD